MKLSKLFIEACFDINGILREMLVQKPSRKSRRSTDEELARADLRQRDFLRIRM